jgi:TPR repeat protein
MTNLGEIYKNGEGVRINLEKARDWFIKAIERGSDTAGKSLIEIGSAEDMFAVANIYAYGFGKVNQDDKQAVKWYKRAARTGSIKAINALIEIYTLGRGNVEQDYEKVAKWALKAIEKGDNNAIFTLGYLYSMGSGVKKDDKKAVILWTEAAEKGNKEAWDYLGLYYTHGRGVTQDLEKASKCFENSLKNGGPFNAFTLGEIYRDGKEVQQNFEKAIGCFRKTLERGYGMFAGEAGNALGEMYRDGIGVEKNLEKAKEYFMKANKKGCSNAMKNLEEMLSGGRNVDKKEEVSLIIDKQEVEREEKEKTYLFIIQGNDVKEINNLAKIYYNERNFEKATELYKRATELLLSLQNK